MTGKRRNEQIYIKGYTSLVENTIFVGDKQYNGRIPDIPSEALKTHAREVIVLSRSTEPTAEGIVSFLRTEFSRVQDIIKYGTVDAVPLSDVDTCFMYANSLGVWDYLQGFILSKTTSQYPKKNLVFLGCQKCLAFLSRLVA